MGGDDLCDNLVGRLTAAFSSFHGSRSHSTSRCYTQQRGRDLYLKLLFCLET